MTRNARIVKIQKRIGAEPDGFWGPKSIAACQKHLKKILEECYREGPYDTPPFGSDSSMETYYGKPMDESNLVLLPVSGLGIKYAGSPVKAVRVHKKANDSLRAILEEISRSEWAYILEEYAGVYNARKMRGGARPSKHAWGVAIDLNPDENMLNEHWPTSATMPIEVMEIFAKHGWMAAGAFWSRDAMHFERTRPG